MATADISSSFVIRVIQSAPGAEVINVANPGRSFTIQQIEIDWDAVQPDISGSAVQVAKVASGGAVTNLFTFGSGVLASRASLPAWEADNAPQNTTLAKPQNDANFVATDNIRISVAGAATQVEVILYCIGNPSQSLTVS